MSATGMKPIWIGETRIMAEGKTRELNTETVLAIHWGVPGFCATGVYADVWLEQKQGHAWMPVSQWINGYPMAETSIKEATYGLINYVGTWVSPVLPDEPGYYRIKVKTSSACGGGVIELPYYINLFRAACLPAPELQHTEGVYEKIDCVFKWEVSLRSISDQDLSASIPHRALEAGAPVRLLLSGYDEFGNHTLMLQGQTDMPESGPLALSIPNIWLKQLGPGGVAYLRYFVHYDDIVRRLLSHSTALCLVR
ncbi:hypothetical protein ACPRNU_18735 [Chromobacterium vaccinii]|uniref:hypothetical protein n=1 Tax=Chromobacterium vaccinii TaxID=1108595 RepID=UPI003C76A761